tara:strand:- start:311 stop:487 length:177 start_codon:yes stop_codon:yes gene_type:complete
MREKFEDVLKRELRNEFKKELGIDVNEGALNKVMKDYKKIKNNPLNIVRELDKKRKES